MNRFLFVVVLLRWLGGLWKVEIERKEINIFLKVVPIIFMLREEIEVFQTKINCQWHSNISDIRI